MKALVEAVYLGCEVREFKNRETGKPESAVQAAFLQGLDVQKFYIRDDADFDIWQFNKGIDVVMTVDINVRADKTYQSLVGLEEGKLLVEEPPVGKVMPDPVETDNAKDGKGSSKK